MPQTSTIRINGPALRGLRVAQGLTRAQLAAKTGRQTSSIRNLENGDGKAASDVFAVQIARALGGIQLLPEFTFEDGTAEPGGTASDEDLLEKAS